MPRPVSSHWLAYVGTFLAALAFAWNATSAWFGLLQRVHDLEVTTRYIHGDAKAFLPKEGP